MVILEVPLSAWPLNLSQHQQHFGHLTFFLSLAGVPVGLENKIKYVRAAIRGLSFPPFLFSAPRALTFTRFMSVLRMKWRLRRALT